MLSFFLQLYRHICLPVAVSALLFFCCTVKVESVIFFMYKICSAVYIVRMREFSLFVYLLALFTCVNYCVYYLHMSDRVLAWNTQQSPFAF